RPFVHVHHARARCPAVSALPSGSQETSLAHRHFGTRVFTGMIKVFNKDTNELLGRISEGDLQFLKDQLEKESLDDHDYYMTRETIETFAQFGASESLNSLLQGAIRNQNAIEIRWEADLAASTPTG
ncbi:MAG: monogalactosyldiacylglycerol synthase, partial [Verrucomicrobiales bacterium]|nr:monogalactosyldiacylglycerol synthase [Verrucomicrobiales bacterium]